MDNPSGYYDENTRTIFPTSTSTWSGLSGTTWADWNEWAYDTSDQIIWVTQPIFLGNNPSAFNLEITCQSTAEISYKVYTSNIGVFAGEEQETVIDHNATTVPAFRSRFIQVVVYANKVNGITPSISEITISTKTPQAKETIINDLDSSTCLGTQTARVIPTNGDTGFIIDIKITPHSVTPYNLDVYVTNTPTSTYLIPKIISKDSVTPTFALVGVDNQPRDGIVDIVLKSLSNGRMNGNNLITE